MSIERITEYYISDRNNLVKVARGRHGLGDNAEDVVQTAFERALRYHTQLNADLPIGPWFYTIMLNCISDHYRSERGIVWEELDEHSHEATWGGLEVYDLFQTITTRIQKEPPDHQPILELHFLKGYPAIEIYQFNNVSYPNTRKIIQRFRDKLRKEFPPC